MSAVTATPFNKADSTPQSVQRLLDENAQLIKALVENMSTKGKSMECIQYQQTLHRNLVFLAGLADPNLNIQALLPTPGSSPMPPRSNPNTQLPPPSTTTQAPFSTSSGASPGSVGSVSSSNGATQMPPRQPQATMQPSSSSSEAQWAANSQAARATPPSTMSAGQFPGPAGNMRNFEGGMWSNQGQQQGMYGMQRGSGYGSMMGMSPEDRQRQQQMLRMRQEQYIQAQQMRRMQMQQQQQGGPGGGGMYPGMSHGPSTGMMPPGGMPPNYPQNSMMPMSMPPPGPMNLQ